MQHTSPPVLLLCVCSLAAAVACALQGSWTRNSNKGGDPYAYSRTWTKEAYGGEYHVARSRVGADAMQEKADEVELGYEKPVGGVTTNFVGNHMTQGAIDLVQAELNRPDPYYEARALGAAAARAPRALPQRVEADAEAGADAATGAVVPREEAVSAPERFSWSDEGANVVVRVPEPRLEAAAALAAAQGGGDGAYARVVRKADFSSRGCHVEWSRGQGAPRGAFSLRDTFGALDASACRVAADEAEGEVVVTLAKLSLADAVAPWAALERTGAARAAAEAARGCGGRPMVDARALRRSLKAARAARDRGGPKGDECVARAMAHAAEIAAGGGAAAAPLPAPGGGFSLDGTGPGDDAGDVPEGATVASAADEADERASLGDYDGAVRCYTWALRLAASDVAGGAALKTPAAPAAAGPTPTPASGAGAGTPIETLKTPEGAFATAPSTPATAFATPATAFKTPATALKTPASGTAALAASVASAANGALEELRASLLERRAAALAQLGAFGAVERDCSAALALCPTFAAALLRRAMAREACERYEAAAADARAALAADPSERRASDITRRCASAAAAERTREARLAARHESLSAEALEEARHTIERLRMDGEKEEVLPAAQEGTDYFNTKPGKRPGSIM